MGPAIKDQYRNLHRPARVSSQASESQHLQLITALNGTSRFHLARAAICHFTALAIQKYLQLETGFRAASFAGQSLSSSTGSKEGSNSSKLLRVSAPTQEAQTLGLLAIPVRFLLHALIQSSLPRLGLGNHVPEPLCLHGEKLLVLFALLPVGRVPRPSIDGVARLRILVVLTPLLLLLLPSRIHSNLLALTLRHGVLLELLLLVLLLVQRLLGAQAALKAQLSAPHLLVGRRHRCKLSRTTSTL
ncbi:hypothetical protein M758_12G185300 [Ceratodon purpureus]|nr:hypothetical protein M758_12G185300 [Ceratodon purpureus]